MATLGFIGLCQMGGQMATHLAREEHNIIVFDQRRTAIDAVVTVGATGVDSTTAVGERTDIVFLSLPDPVAVKAVVSDIEASLEPGSIVVDMTTSTPDVTRSIAERLGDKDVTVLGAPTSEGASGAADGTLTMMIGGDSAALKACDEYFDAFATDVFHVGDDPGHGHTVKLLNNFLSNTAMVSTSEAIVLGQQVGLNIETMCDVFNVSTGRNSATEDKFPDTYCTGRRRRLRAWANGEGPPPLT